MALTRESFVVYKSFYEGIKELSDEDQLETFKALFEYGLYQNNYEGSSKITKALLITFKPGIDNASNRYLARVENGKKGGRPMHKNNLEKPRLTKPNLNDNVYVNDNVNVNVYDNETNHPVTCGDTPPREGNKCASAREVFVKYSKDNKELLGAFEAFEEMRRKIKKPLTSRAAELICAKLQYLSQGSSENQITIVEQSTLHCWQDLYELKPPGLTLKKETQLEAAARRLANG